MARKTIAVQSGVYADGGDKVDSAFFGGNFLFDRDKIGDEGTYDEKAEALNLGMLRYPDGTITEKFFDIRNPDEAIKPGAHGDDVMPLSEFIAHLNDVGTTASLVLPSLPRKLPSLVPTHAWQGKYLTWMPYDLKIGTRRQLA